MATVRVVQDIQAWCELLKSLPVATVLGLPLPTLYELARKDDLPALTGSG